MSAVAVLRAPGSPKRRGRSSRQDAIRQAPKKGGHGGWGKIGDQGSEQYELYIGDPNFDDEDEWVDGVPSDFQPSKRKRNNSSITFEVSTPRVAPHDMEELSKEQIRQYLMNEDMEDFVHSIKKLKIDRESMGEIIFYAVNLSLDHESRERELVSLLISGLSPNYLSDEATRKGFNQLVMAIDEIVVDSPDAEDAIAKFLARAVADDCLAPCFLSQHDGLSPRAISLVKKAQKLLDGPHGMARLDAVWGHTGGSTDLDVLKENITMLIKEYMSSKDVAEAARCLNELNVSHYHHEAVYQIVYHALQYPDSGDSLFALLKTFITTNICNDTSVGNGVKRIYTDLIDISIDVPYAYPNLEYWITDAHNKKVISDELYAARPKQARKRYASSSLAPPS